MSSFLSTASRCVHAVVRRLVVEARTLAEDVAGTIIVNLAIVLPLLVTLVGFSLDYATVTMQQHQLQAITDAAALAGAKELSIPGPADTMSGRVDAMVASSIGGAVNDLRSMLPVQSDAVVEADGRSVTVTATQEAKSFFGARFGLKIPVVTAKATASVVGTMNLCVLGLERAEPGVVGLVSNSTLVAKGCAVYANSSSSNGLFAMDNAKITADLICTAGGKTGGKGNYDPQPMTDCPMLDDPLADRQPPSVSACTRTGLVIADQTITLSPGVYCGGLVIKGASKVTLDPGVYVIKNGPFYVHDTATLTGRNVGFHLYGTFSLLLFTQNSTIDLTAPKAGPLAGILIFEDRAKPTLGIHTITSRNARTLLGTIYLPHSTFLVDAEAPVADKSAYTAIIVKRLLLKTGPALVLNTDYGATDVPVPPGVGSMTGKVALTR